MVIDEAFGRGSDDSPLRAGAVRQLDLQLLIVTPLQKIQMIEPFVAGRLRAQRGRGSSMLHNLTIEEYRAQKARMIMEATQ